MIGGCVRAMGCDWWMCSSDGLSFADVCERWAVIGSRFKVSLFVTK